jgi:hypothetical protein
MLSAEASHSYLSILEVKICRALPPFTPIPSQRAQGRLYILSIFAAK